MTQTESMVHIYKLNYR